ncbi:rRNA methyltransferase 2, mitochondrial [Frankliniella fusca]|uniref:rRNA methyltransferase 2, mitochondrial n=1 Tax=Frankliniella fusca TaxID=407009 RepID=A0AAE1GUX8_9NEOP|nr:rRNA methyltransferase 2, mitochondrial [Frankliniella fusca]
MLKLKSNLRSFGTFQTMLKQIPNDLKGRKTSSQEWLRRQLKDPYVEKAKIENYRSRSAFKLIEIDDKFKFLTPGKIVLDCGASPGGWTQVACQRCNANENDSNAPVGTVIGIDLIKIRPIPGATLLSPMDFTSDVSQKKLQEILDSRLVDVFLSDMAPNATGMASLDHEQIMELTQEALRFSLQVSSPGSVFLVKIWNGGRLNSFLEDLKRFYLKVQIVKPPASRKESPEIYVLGKDFKGLKKRK